jgi:hypothetical protein
MRYLIKSNENLESPGAVIASISTGTKSPEELLDALTRFGVEWYVTEEGTLMIKYWQVGAEGFVSPEQAGIIRSFRPIPGHSDQLDWLGKNLENIHRDYAGKWIAIYDNRIVGTARNLPDLMAQLAEFDGPFITFIPSEPIVWTFTYAG